MTRVRQPYKWHDDDLYYAGDPVYQVASSEIYDAATSSECHEEISRNSQAEPCNHEAVALRVDIEGRSIYPVCTFHARPPLVPWNVIAARLLPPGGVR